MYTFNGKVVLVTGASQGIGRAIARKFASMGAKIALNDISFQEEQLKAAAGEMKSAGAPEAEYFLADVSKYGEVEKMMADVAARFGQLDVLVNNAGIAKDRTLAKMTAEEWQKVIDVNLTSVFNCSKAALPMIIARQGNIVSMSSFSGLRGSISAKRIIPRPKPALSGLPKLCQRRSANSACASTRWRRDLLNQK